jgi:hypothetical protein
VIVEIKQWENKYIRDFEVVRSNEVSEEKLYRLFTGMYYNFTSENDIEPFSISYGRSNGFCINANSHVGIIVYDELTLFINSMVPELSLGKILYLNSLAEDVSSASDAKKVIVENLNDEDNISAIDYFVISMMNAVEEIHANGLISELKSKSAEMNRIVGKLDIKNQITKSPAYEKFYVEKTESDVDILINQIIKKAIAVAMEKTTINWARPLLNSMLGYFSEVSDLQDIEERFPDISEYTLIKRNDYENALRFSKFILFGFDPLEGDDASNFPEFLLDMNEVFEYYVNVGLKNIFKEGYYNKIVLSLGVGPKDIPIERKNIELDGFYDIGNSRVVVDTKNKYRTVLDRSEPDFMAANPDIYQQYYYASRVNAKNIVLVYPSSKRKTVPIGYYQLNFENNKDVDLYFWALQISSTPKENRIALIALAKFIESL